MALTADQKQEIVKGHQRGQSDTGSPEVQVALLTGRIESLTGHFENNKHDHHSRRGLVKMVNQRRQLLSYLKANDKGRYQDLIARLGLRR
jgi:small subunit ribosomal protein S15